MVLAFDNTLFIISILSVSSYKVSIGSSVSCTICSLCYNCCSFTLQSPVSVQYTDKAKGGICNGINFYSVQLCWALCVSYSNSVCLSICQSVQPSVWFQNKWT